MLDAPHLETPMVAFKKSGERFVVAEASYNDAYSDEAHITQMSRKIFADDCDED